MMKKRYIPGILLTFGGLLCAVSAQESQGQEDVYTLSPFEIATDGGLNDYMASESITGTRVATSIQDLPFAVNVVTVEFINDFVAEDLGDQFAYISAFAPDGSQEGAYQLRGFRQENQLRNGFTRLGLVSRTNMDRAEVIKGPNAAIYGRTDPGGIINIITKRPEKKFSQRVDLAAGNNNYLRGQVSSTGPLGSDKLLYRVDVSYLDMDVGIAYMGREEQTYSGVFEYLYGDGNRISLEMEYLKRDQQRGRRLMFYYEDNKSGDAPDRYMGIANDLFDRSFVGPHEFNNRDVKTYNLTWEHKFSQNVNFRASANTFDRTYYQWTTFPSRVVSQGSQTNNIGFMPSLEPSYKDIHEQGDALQADLLTQFDTGDIQHKLLFTVDYQKETKDDLDYRYNRNMTKDQMAELQSRIGEPITNKDLRRVTALNVFNIAIDDPDFSSLDHDHISIIKDVTRYGQIGDTAGTIGTGRLDRDNYDDIEVFGFFMSERMEMLDGRLLMFGNMRYDEVTSTLQASSVNSSNKYSESESDFSVDDITYAMGVNYEIANDVRVYANYATSFQKQTEFNDTDPLTGDQLSQPEYFDNEQGKGWEIGAKTSLGDSFFSTLTYFSIEKDNIVIPDSVEIPDPENPADTILVSYKTANGKEKSSGLELDFNWLLSPSFQLTGAYGYVDSEIVRAVNSTLEGLPSAQTPMHNFGLMGRYQVNEGTLKGFEMGVGYRYTSKSRPTNDSDRELFYQDGYQLLEGFIGYRFENALGKQSIQLTVKNLLDEQYTVGYLNRGEPRRWILKWNTRF